MAGELYEHGGRLGWSDSKTASEMCEFARNGDLERIKMLCSLGCNVNAADYDGRSCLHVAASAGNKLIVSALLEAGGELLFLDHWLGLGLASPNPNPLTRRALPPGPLGGHPANPMTLTLTLFLTLTLSLTLPGELSLLDHWEGTPLSDAVRQGHRDIANRQTLTLFLTLTLTLALALALTLTLTLTATSLTG